MKVGWLDKAAAARNIRVVVTVPSEPGVAGHPVAIWALEQELTRLAADQAREADGGRAPLV